ncbi:MAG TPA: signal recognition particle protein, partial [Calditrichaeota bacterium]|nr:signal recognition particle protein [Calditrichota bacterium]
LEKKLKKAEFDLEDFLDQLQQIKKMGSLESLLKMIPGVGSQLGNAQVDDRGLVRVEAIINSMTRDERRNPRILNGSRRKRIAAGSGTRVQDVNRLMNQFQQMKKMLKQFKGKPGRGLGKMPFGFA